MKTVMRIFDAFAYFVFLRAPIDSWVAWKLLPFAGRHAHREEKA
jgi:hypothetical protein